MKKKDRESLELATKIFSGLAGGAGATVIGKALQTALDKGYDGIAISFIKREEEDK